MTILMLNSRLPTALDYLNRGWSVLALCPPDHACTSAAHREQCRSPGKSPLGAWKVYQERLPQAGELVAAFNDCPTANLGVALGPVSGMLGLDIDGPAGEQLLAEWQQRHGDLPATLEFTTPGGGRRLLFAWPGELAPPTHRFAVAGKEAVRILSAGSQTVMPPSKHVNGGEYGWVTGRRPGEVAAAPLPQWLLLPPSALLHAPASRRAGPGGTDGATDGGDEPRRSPAIERARAYLARCPGAISGQGGHNRTFFVACKLVKGFGLSPDEALDILVTDYNPRCEPPWTEKELRHKVDDAAKQPDDSGYLLHGPRRPRLAEPILPAEPCVRTVKDVAERAVEWLWPGRLPLGKVTVLDGDPGLGKSTMLLDLAARVSVGAAMPDGSPGVAGAVLVLSGEDAADDTIKPRLLAADADVGRVHILTHVAEGGAERPIEIPFDLGVIDEVIAARGVKLLLIDPLMAFLTGVDAVKDQDVRRALYRLATLAERRGCAVVCLRHLNKGTSAKALYRGGGSIGIIGAARAGLLVAADPDLPHYRVLAVTKANLAGKPPSLRFVLEPTAAGVCRVGWCGESRLGADELLGAGESSDDRSAKEEAIDLLRTLLADGPRPAEDCYAEAKRQKIGETTLRKAKVALGVVSKQNNSFLGQFQSSLWALPVAHRHTGTPGERK
jgi:hypothetical protein